MVRDVWEYLLVRTPNRWLVIMGARWGPAAESIDLLKREFAAGKVNKERRGNLARTPSRKLKLQDGAIEHLGARFDAIIVRSARATTRTRKLTGALHY